MTWTVKNIGRVTTSSNSWYDTVYGSEVNDFSQSKQLGRVSQRRYVEPNGQYSSQFKFKLNERDDFPAYFIFVVVDKENTLDDFDTSNNQLSTPKMIQIKPLPLPNLEATRVQVEEVGKAGEKFLVEWTVTNVGEGEVRESKQWTDTVEIFVIDENLALKLATRAIVRVDGKRLAPNENYFMRVELTIPVRSFGQASVQLVTNAYDTLYEMRLDDNKASSLFTILPPDTPDLGILSVDLSADSILTGQQLVITYVVENEGSGDLDATAWSDEVRIVPATGLGGSNPIAAKTLRNSSKCQSLLKFIQFDEYSYSLLKISDWPQILSRSLR